MMATTTNNNIKESKPPNSNSDQPCVENGQPRFRRLRRGPSSALQKLSGTIIGSFETFFYNWGYSIATHPWNFILGCLLFSLFCSFGLLGFNPENRPDKLWIPWNSDFARDSDWMRRNFPSPVRFHYAILKSEGDVLQPSIMQKLYDIHKSLNAITVQGQTWKDICFKLPVTKFNQENDGENNIERRRKRRRRDINSNNLTYSISKFEGVKNVFENFDDNFDDEFFSEDFTQPDTPSVLEHDHTPEEMSAIDRLTEQSLQLPDFLYCEIINSLKEACWESSIIELWNFNETEIYSLTKQDILNKINSPTISPVFGRSVDYAIDLGGVEKNETGHIVTAKALQLRWYGKIKRVGKLLSDIGTGETVDEVNLEWEKQLSELLDNLDLPEGVKLHYNLARSFGDISQATIWGDARMLAVGFGIVFIYVVFMLGQYNVVEQRPWLSLAGLSCVILAIFVSYGICSAFGIIYGPVHNVLPFLLLGIGVDDMFVIMQSWINLSKKEKKGSLQERMGLTMKHAGVSISVTSLTDFVAFAIGGTTVLPALQSFCIYAAIGIVATYFFQATFFVSWFTLDQRRVESHRNAFIPCIKHRDYKPNQCSQIPFAKLFFEKIYSRILFSKPAKILVIVGTCGILGMNIWGNVELRQEFSPIWFLPHESSLFQYVKARDEFFPKRGYEAFVVMDNVSFPQNLPQLDSLVTALESSPSIYTVDAWYPGFKNYTNKYFDQNIPNKLLTDREFKKYLGKFLYSPTGSKYRVRIKTSGNLTCGKSSPDIKLSSLHFKFNTFHGPEEHVPAMYEIKGLIKNANFTPKGESQTFVWSMAFATWETDAIITAELYRNMGLAMGCVLITTLFLIANLSTCIMVLTCVTFTLVDVGGMMHFWGLTIDTVSCIDLVLAIGLSVDYCSHIGHAFMTCVGTREERAKQALINIGPAVLNGGFSTFLAFILLATSKSHVFITFFKIFFLVVFFGLFHGLVFLPVLLSIFGPQPYASAVERHRDNEAAVELNPTNISTRISKGNGILINGNGNGSLCNGSNGSSPTKAKNGLLLDPIEE